ncbi:unnamed protein product [Didymodactylos carnosus]|uniref:DDE Tnp4 domain-containing protein n=1 Tax=Didymodactylos carnosus TaxID=1234261 RepID=A0A813VJ45_9BILA|nr:unnamed protein product [Didymodactylos carnosus]CAF3626600.1 unnamed protein product [Didymodactylos carnosus]
MNNDMRNRITKTIEFFKFTCVTLSRLIELLEELELNQHQMAMSTCIFSLLTAFIQLIPLIPQLTIYHITMPVDHYERAVITNLYAELANTSCRFLTGLPPSAFNDIFPLFVQEFDQKRRLILQYRFSTTMKTNILLLLLIWLRTYSTNNVLSVMFKVSKYKVCRYRKTYFPLLVRALRSQMKWPSPNEMVNLVVYHPILGRYIGYVDGSRHFIQRPRKNQRLYYSGSVYDSKMLRRAGIGNLPIHTRLLADKGFGNGNGLLTPVRRNELNRFPLSSKKLFNYFLSNKRIFVEHLIKEMKVFEAVHGVFRHERQQWYGVSLCTAYLANVRASLFLQ